MSGASVAGALAAARDGDEQAFVRLWTDANPGLVRYLRVLAPADADELAVRTWIELAGKLRRFRGDEAAWRRLVFTTARSCVRQQGATPASSVASRALAADDTLDSMLTRVALDLVAVLPEPQPEVIVLRTAGQLDVSDVAKVLKLSEPTVRAAAHAGLAQAGALAAEDATRGLIDRGEHVEEPPGWERTGFVAGLGTVETAFEDLLARRSVGPGAPARTKLIAAVLAALRAPASPADLRGLDAARAAYERQFAGVPRHAVGVLRLGSRAAVGAAAAVIGLSGTAFAAYAGMLPAPLQDAAHNWFNAPAHSPDQNAPGHTSPGSSQPSAPSTGSTGAPGPGTTSGPAPGTTSGPAPGTTKATPGAVSTSPGAPAHTPPGATKIPPGSTKTPPGSTMTPPGSTNTPPGSTKTPPGSTKTPPGSTKTPPGSTKTPPGSTKTPPGSTKTPPGSTRTASATNTPPGSTKTPPGSTRTASATDTPPGSTKTPPGSSKTPPGSTKSPHGSGTDQSR